MSAQEKLRPPHIHEGQWAYVDIRVNKDGTAEVVMCDRWNATPVPMVEYCKRPTVVNPVPDIPCTGLDLQMAFRVASVFDTLFIAEFKGEKADYGQHAEFAAKHLDADWERKLQSRNERGTLISGIKAPTTDSAFQSAKKDEAFALRAEEAAAAAAPVPKPAAKAVRKATPKAVVRVSDRSPLGDLDTF